MNSRLVSALKLKMEYVTKKRSKKDGRIFHVFIQPKADNIKKDVQNCWKQVSDIALNGISATEQQQILDKIENNIVNDQYNLKFELCQYLQKK